jgi:predicted RNA-binding Zn ribbon-like protein
MTKTIETMRLSGGHPVLDFVNTVDSRGDRWGPDLLESFSDLMTFAQRVGLTSESTDKDLEQGAVEKDRDIALSAAKELRECLYRVFLAEGVGGNPSRDDIAYLEEAATSARSRQRFSHDNGTWYWEPRFEEPLDVVHLFAISGANLLAAKDGRRPVKECQGDNCGWLFLDHSKGGRRKWCSEESCGTHSRVKRFRSK